MEKRAHCDMLSVSVGMKIGRDQVNGFYILTEENKMRIKTYI